MLLHGRPRRGDIDAGLRDCSLAHASSARSRDTMPCHDLGALAARELGGRNALAER